MAVMERKKIEFEPARYLTPSDKERIQFIKKAVRRSKSLEEIKQYDAEMQRLIKKAYLRMGKTQG